MPGNHAWLQVEVGRIAAIVDHFRGSHACSGLEVIGADALSAVEHMAGVHPQLCQVHGTGMAHGSVWQTGDIGHVLSLCGERHGYVGLAAAILAGERVSLRQSQVVVL